MIENIKKQLENIRRDAINELGSFILLARTVIDSDKYSNYDYANSYIITLFEHASGNALRTATTFYSGITNSKYCNSIAPVLSDCKEIISTLTTFYNSLLTTHIEQIQSIIETNTQISRTVLTSFLTATQALQDHLKQI